MDYTLRNIIKEYLIETGDTQLNKYARFYQYGVSGLREFNITSSGILRTANLAIKANDTCDLPADYIKYTKIGLIGNDGEIHAMGLNESLSYMEGFNNCGDPQQLTTTTDVVLGDNGDFRGRYRNSGDDFRNGEFMGRMFGFHGGVNPYGEYRIDRDNQVIIIKKNRSITTKIDGGQEVSIHIENIAMEYIADIKKIDDDFEVHPFMVEALKSWMFYKSIQRNMTINAGEKDRARRDYYNEERITKNRFNSHTIDEWKTAFRKGNVAAFKF